MLFRSARPAVDQNNLPAVSFTLSAEGARKFGTVTESNIGRRLAIILDNRITSAPTIQSRITDNGQITGVTRDEVNDLTLILFVNLTAIQFGWAILGASQQKLSWRGGVEFFTVMLALAGSVLCWRIAAAQRPMAFGTRCVWLAIMFGLLKLTI